MIARGIRRSLAARSTAAILGMVSLGALAALLAGGYLASQYLENQQERFIEGLLLTVDNPLQVAVFLGDVQLATELARGLVENRLVAGVEVEAEGASLAMEGSMPAPGDASPSDILVRDIFSPFDTREKLGTLRLLPDYNVLAEETTNSLRLLGLMLVLLLLAVAVSVVLVVIVMVTRPIVDISEKLHSLAVSTGEKLIAPAGHKKDELGSLVADVNRMVDSFVEILGREREERQERERGERRLRAILDTAENGIFLVSSAGQLLSCNPAFSSLFGLPENTEEKLPVNLVRVLGQDADDLQSTLDEVRRTGRSQRRDFALADTRSPRWLSLIVSPLEDDIFQGIVHDVTAHALAQQEAENRATTDSLTGIYNREGFELALDRHFDIQRKDRSGEFTLAMLDLDYFKEVNDRHGHQAGDKVLQMVARRIKSLLRAEDIVARTGGDEFAVIIGGEVSEEVLARIAAKIVQSLGEPISLETGKTACIGVSIGLATRMSEDHSAANLIRRTDEAMYQAKREGRNTYRFAAPDGAQEAPPSTQR